MAHNEMISATNFSITILFFHFYPIVILLHGMIFRQVFSWEDLMVRAVLIGQFSFFLGGVGDLTAFRPRTLKAHLVGDRCPLEDIAEK